MSYASYEDVAARIAALPRPGLAAIDGLPVSGKSTLADRLIGELGLEAIYLDDFVLPQSRWPMSREPAFPFPYIRYAEFIAAVETLASTGSVEFFPFDWQSGDTATEPRRVTLDRPVLIEGVSALHPLLCPHYALRLFVASDRDTTLDASIARGVGSWLDEWRNWFLPSVDLYFATAPASRADLVLAGRGAPPSGKSAGVRPEPLL
jgi:uridine kinase